MLAYIPTPSETAGSGGLAGGSGGCDYQSRQWVVGFEADIDWAHISGTSNTSGSSGASPGQFQIGQGVFTGIDTSATANEQVSLRWLTTIRARAGVALQDRVLLYATGGLAVGGVNSQGSVIAQPGTVSAVIWNGSNSMVKAGYVVGGGVEWAFYDR